VDFKFPNLPGTDKVLWAQFLKPLLQSGILCLALFR
jgi:hypothetical protein